MLQNHQSFKLERDQSPNSIVGNFTLKNTRDNVAGSAPEDDSSEENVDVAGEGDEDNDDLEQDDEDAELVEDEEKPNVPA